jgi:uncharacterized protein
MQRTPCEQLQYNLLPNLRKELANCLIEVFKLSQKNAAEKMGLTPAAISQYKHKKRAGNSSFPQEIMMEIVASANKINLSGDSIVNEELCRLCCLVRKNEITCKIDIELDK